MWPRESRRPTGASARENLRSRPDGRRDHRQEQRSRERWKPCDSRPPRRENRSRSARRRWSPKRPAHATGYAYGEGRRAEATRALVGYAYGEARRGVDAATTRNGRGQEDAGRQATAPRNALIPVGRRPPCRPAKLGKQVRGVRRSDSYSAGESLSNSGSQSSSGSCGSGFSYSYYDEEEEEEEHQVKQAAKPPEKKASGKDDIVHFEWRTGMVLNMKYELKKALGDGTFGRVVLAHDRRNDRDVAVKIIRDVKRYMDNAKIEADILKDVRKADPAGISRCAVMYETFTHERKYYCLVFEPLGVSLYDFMKKNAYRGFWLQDIQSFAQQCMKAMDFLHTSLRLAHTDLKPENILLESAEQPHPARFFREKEWQVRRPSQAAKEPPPYVRPASSHIKIIDFGNATYESDHHSSIINTRQYRGPEVVLEMTWDHLSDIWSLGCIFLELYTGELLFGTHDNCEHLALMEKILQPLPARILDLTPVGVKEKYLKQDRKTRSWLLDWPAKASSQQSEQHVRNARSLSDIVREPHHKTFLDCVYSMLTADSQKRPSAAKVLKETFFQEKFDD